MPTTKNVIFSYKELAEALVRQADVHEGNWGIYVEFGLQGANVTSPTGDLTPSAVVGDTKLGIQRFDNPNNLTVDAAEINPVK